MQTVGKKRRPGIRIGSEKLNRERRRFISKQQSSGNVISIMQRTHFGQMDLQFLFICKSPTVYSQSFAKFNTPELQAMQAWFYTNYTALIEARTKPVDGEIQYPHLYRSRDCQVSCHLLHRIVD